MSKTDKPDTTDAPTYLKRMDVTATGPARYLVTFRPSDRDDVWTYTVEATTAEVQATSDTPAPSTRQKREVIHKVAICGPSQPTDAVALSVTPQTPREPVEESSSPADAQTDADDTTPAETDTVTTDMDETTAESVARDWIDLHVAPAYHELINYEGYDGEHVRISTAYHDDPSVREAVADTFKNAEPWEYDADTYENYAYPRELQEVVES